MNPDASIRKTWRGAAEGAPAGTAAGCSARRAPVTSSILASRGDLADLTRRRSFAQPLLAGLVRRRHCTPSLLGAPAGLRDRPVDEPARAIWALDPARRR